MKVSISVSENGLEHLKKIRLTFDEQVPTSVKELLVKVGFKFIASKNHYQAKKNSSRIGFAQKLKEAVEAGQLSPTIAVEPSFDPDQENLVSKLYSHVAIVSSDQEGKTIRDEFIVFDPDEVIAQAIAQHYVDARKKEGYHYEIQVTPKGKIGKSRKLFNVGEILVVVDESVKIFKNLKDEQKTSISNFQELDDSTNTEPLPTKEEKSEEFYSEVMGRPNDYIYKEYHEFESDVLYQMEVRGGLTRSDAQGIMMANENESITSQYFITIKKPTPVDAKNVAAILLEEEGTSKEPAELFPEEIKTSEESKQVPQQENESTLLEKATEAKQEGEYAKVAKHLDELLEQIKDGFHYNQLPFVVEKANEPKVRGEMSLLGWDDYSGLLSTGDFCKNLPVPIWDLIPEKYKKEVRVKSINWKASPKDEGLKKLVSKFTGEDLEHEAEMGVFFDEHGIVATDRHKLLFIHHPNKEEDQGVYCMTKKCFDNIQIQPNEEKWEAVDKKRAEEFRNTTKYPDYKVAIAYGFKEVFTIQTTSLLTYLVAIKKSKFYPDEYKSILLKGGNHIIGFNVLVLEPAVRTMLSLGHERVDIGINSDRQPMVLSPVETNSNLEDRTTDFAVAMPMIVKQSEGNNQLEKGDFYYDLEHDAPVTVGVKSATCSCELKKEKKTPKKVGETHLKKEGNKKVIPQDIVSRGNEIPNVLIPSEGEEPFVSGSLYVGDGEKLEKQFPALWKLTNKDLPSTNALEMFYLSQMSHPIDYGIKISRGELLREWENRGEELFKELGFPIDRNYPYVNIHTGYGSVDSLGKEINENHAHWWSVMEHYRPIANMDKAIEIIEQEIIKIEVAQRSYTNPKTGKVKSDKESKEEHRSLEWDKERLVESKSVVEDYLKTQKSTSSRQEKPESKKDDIYTTKDNFQWKLLTKKEAEKAFKDGEEVYGLDLINETNSLIQAEVDLNDFDDFGLKIGYLDYLDRVVAHMEDAYMEGKRVTTGQITKLSKELGVPNMGQMWEAVELSWLLWYKRLYKQRGSFEKKIVAMQEFWDKIQPTYQYSDSSKEIYKQYSTPCPIGAIVAEYTGMKTAKAVFEPSAGNGLLVLGANPKNVHVNEIDKSRLKSLEFQGFKTITNWNATQPFPKDMSRTQDVVVTNPPFAKWDDTKYDKKAIVKKYFSNQIGLVQHMKLEHLMAGIALDAMKDNGKAGIIIMGHISFDNNGLIAKYRPFFNWLCRHYYIDDIISMNSYKMYSKQGAVAKTMLILINGRKPHAEGVSPKKNEAPHLEEVVDDFIELWDRVKPLITHRAMDNLIKKLKIESDNNNSE